MIDFCIYILPATTIFIRVSNAPMPNPHNALATINITIDWAAPQRMEPTKYDAVANKKQPRLPNISTLFPYMGCEVDAVKRKA